MDEPLVLVGRAKPSKIKKKELEEKG